MIIPTFNQDSIAEILTQYYTIRTNIEKQTPPSPIKTQLPTLKDVLVHRSASSMTLDDHGVPRLLTSAKTVVSD
jgi:hypothetical protein